MDNIARESAKLKNCISINPYAGEAGAAFAQLWMDSINHFEKRKRNMVAQLKQMGIKACHPNDGWVKRTNYGDPYQVYFCYPDFQDKIEINDIIALTSYDEELKHDVVTTHKVHSTENWGFTEIRLNYNIRPTGDRYWYRDDGQLELVDESNKARFQRWLNKPETAEQIISFVFYTSLIIGSFYWMSTLKPH